MSKPRLVVFASGTKDGGGSGLFHLILNRNTGVLNADIIGVVSNHSHGGVRRIADQFSIPFEIMSHPFSAPHYRTAVSNFKSRPDAVTLSGWLKPVSGLDPALPLTNIHPGLLPRFGGQGMWGHHVHEATIAAFQRGEVTHSAVTMHFVTQGGSDEYDRGPKFFEYAVGISPDDTAETLAPRVNEYEHSWQSWVLDLVVTEQISWDGVNVVGVPDWYAWQPYCPAELGGF